MTAQPLSLAGGAAKGGWPCLATTPTAGGGPPACALARAAASGRGAAAANVHPGRAAAGDSDRDIRTFPDSDFSLTPRQPLPLSVPRRSLCAHEKCNGLRAACPFASRAPTGTPPHPTAHWRTVPPGGVGARPSAALH